MRQGPGAVYAQLEVLGQEAQLSILALNKAKDWALVQTAAGRQGWIYLPFVSVTGSLASAPVVTAAPPAETPAANQKPEAQLNHQTAQVVPISFNTVSQAATPVELSVMLPARIIRHEAEVRPGPSTEYAPIDKITDPQEAISILALDPDGRWALVRPAVAHLGWVALDDLAVEGYPAELPRVYTGWVKSNAVEVRSGPGIFHETVGALAINSLVHLLGLDESRSWGLIKPLSGSAGDAGWTPIQFLTSFGRPMAGIPKAPDLPAPAPAAAPVDRPAGPILPARPISESKIVFQRSSGGEIMIINSDGSGLRPLTNGIDPVLSPDGQTVAFTRWQGETGALWLIGSDGANERAILGNIKQAKGPDWSPDGSQIVLNFQHGGRLEEKKICVDPGSGQPPRQAYDIGVELKDGHKPNLCWKLPPDPHWGLRVISLAGGSFKDVDGGAYAFRPAWDPGQPWRIVSDGGRGLLAVDLNRADRRNLTEELNDGSPVFSPDGRYLALSAGKEGGNAGYDIYRLNADGSGRVRLTETPLWVPVLPGEQKQWNNVAPAWSPDGSQIAFLTDRTGRWEIWLMNTDGSNQRALFSGEINNQLQLTYNFVDERMLSWR